MIKKITNYIYYKFFHAKVLETIKNTLSQPAIHGIKSNIVLGDNVILKHNIEFECSVGKIFLGNNTVILQDVKILSYGGLIEIGENVSVNPFCILYGHGGLKIGNNVRIAANTIMIPSNHNFSRTDIPIYQQGETSKGITIEDDVWIGANVKILDDVKISKGIIVGAGSVVTKPLTKEYGIYAGIPAKFIKYRYDEKDY